MQYASILVACGMVVSLGCVASSRAQVAQSMTDRGLVSPAVATEEVDRLLAAVTSPDAGGRVLNEASDLYLRLVGSPGGAAEAVRLSRGVREAAVQRGTSPTEAFRWRMNTIRALDAVLYPRTQSRAKNSVPVAPAPQPDPEIMAQFGAEVRAAADELLVSRGLIANPMEVSRVFADLATLPASAGEDLREREQSVRAGLQVLRERGGAPTPVEASVLSSLAVLQVELGDANGAVETVRSVPPSDPSVPMDVTPALLAQWTLDLLHERDRADLARARDAASRVPGGKIAAGVGERGIAFFRAYFDEHAALAPLDLTLITNSAITRVSTGRNAAWFVGTVERIMRDHAGVIDEANRQADARGMVPKGTEGRSVTANLLNTYYWALRSAGREQDSLVVRETIARDFPDAKELLQAVGAIPMEGATMSPIRSNVPDPQGGGR